MRPNRNPLLRLDGTSILGDVNTRVVSSTPMNPQQIVALNGMYDVFMTNCRLSIANSHQVRRVMADGTRVLMFFNQGLSTVLVEPAGGNGPADWSAYPAYVDLGFTPVYDRPVIDMPDGPPRDCGPEPEFDAPPFQPGDSYSVVTRYSREILFRVDPEGGPFQPGTTLETIRWGVHLERAEGATHEDIIAVYGTTRTFVNEFSGQTITYSNVPLGYLGASYARDAYGRFFPGGTDLYATGLKVFTGGQSPATGPVDYTDGETLDSVRQYARTQKLEGTFSVTAAAGQNIFVGTAPLYGAVASIDGSFGQQCAVLLASFYPFPDDTEARYQAWAARRNAWLSTTYQAWLNCKSGSSPGAGPVPGIDSLRITSRDAQVSAVRSYLYQGVGPLHLTARLLSFPWNIATEPKNPQLAAGSVAVVGPSGTYGSTDRELTYTASAASGGVEIPFPDLDGSDRSQFPKPPPPLKKMRDQVASPTCIFGALASGGWELKLQYQWFHLQEIKQVAGMDSLSMEVSPQYGQFLKSGVVKARGKSQTICSDGYVPANTEAICVFFEYEVWDPYCKRWFWSPHPDLSEVDSIWIERFGPYDPALRQELGAAEFSPRKVRLAKVISQKRKSDFSWTVPKDIPVEKKWSREYTEKIPDDLVELRPIPCAVVVVSGLAPSAKPVRDGTTVFPFYAKAHHSPSLGGAAFRREWTNYFDPQELVAAATRTIGERK